MFSLFSLDGKVGESLTNSQTRSLKRPIYMLRCITRGRLIHLRMHNVTNCRTYARDLAGGALLWKKTIPTCYSIVWSPYAPFKTLLVPTPLELYSRATMYASRDWRTCTVSGAWDLSGICFASFMVSPRKVLRSKLPLSFIHFAVALKINFRLWLGRE